MWNILWLFLVYAHLVRIITATPLSPIPVGQGLVLSELIRHYEPAVYDRNTLIAQHRRARRDISGARYRNDPIRLDFKAHDREFRLRLRPDPSSIFADNVDFSGTRGDINFDTSRIYSGILEDDETAVVHGLITADGLFDGTITTNIDNYYIEPVSRYTSPSGKYKTSSPTFHSVVYKSSDVTFPDTQTRCASHRLHQQRTSTSDSKVPRSLFDLWGDDSTDIDKGSNELETKHRQKRWLPDEINPDIYSKFSPENTESMGFNLRGDIHDSLILSDRPDTPRLQNPDLPIDLNIPYTRNEDILFKNKNHENLITKTVDSSNPNHKTHVEIITKKVNNNKKPTATLIANYSPNMTDFRHVNKRATVDPKKTTCMLYLQADHQFFQKFGTEESCIEVMTRHVQRVNSIYRVTDFNQDGKADNISFMIKRIKVHTGEALKDPLYRFPGNYGVEKFLELFSEEDYDAFCLAYMFTYRDFEMGTLGLAWTGDLKNAGGVCEKNGHYRGSMKSLNTGIVTLLNYGKHVPPAVSHVTLAHEIGHNFGSPHDPEQCTPGGEDGNFIMFARATSGDKYNNNRFSPCSLKSINPVLNSKARSSKGCFTEPQAAICGNGVVEVGEECDCGWEEDCRDQCCYPQRRYPPHDEPPCRLSPRSICSPSQGPCCTNECQLKFGDKCRDDNGCRDASYCGGSSPQCPPSVNKPNKTICNEEFVCFMGECTGSICLAYGLESCQCIAGANDLATKACELCCKMPGDQQPCLSSFQWNEPPFDVPDMFSKPGTPCNEYNGYCDVFQKCREVDPSGPLATLRRLLLSEESIASFKRWVMNHWYAVALIAAAILALLILSTRLLGKRPDMKLKSVTIIHSSTTETVRLPPEADTGQVIVHTAVRSKVPLKKRVREKSSMKTKSKKSPSKQRLRQNAEPQAGTSPMKAKRKKRVSAPVVAEESRKRNGDAAGIDPAPIKTKKIATPKKKQAKKPKKETIDYSAAQVEPIQSQNVLGHDALAQPEDAVGKVQQWLLDSPQPLVIPKSKSTPVDLTQRSPNKTRILKPRGDKSKSVGNLQDKEKVRLQVVYKPPFKFSLKFRKGDHTSVVVDRSNHRRDKERAKKKDRRNKDSREAENIHPTRTAFLVKSSKEQEPKRNENEIVNADDIAANIITEPTSKSTTLQSTLSAQTHVYENMQNTGADGLQNVKHSKHNSESKNSNNLIHQSSETNIPRTHSRQNSSTNLQRGTSSSITNLHSKPGSSSNLHRGSSNSNIHKGSVTNLNSVRNVLSRHSSSNQINMVRQNSVSNLNHCDRDRTSTRNSSKQFSSSKPDKLKRQSSANDLHLGHSRQGGSSHIVPCSESKRPHTAQCDSSRKKDFEWPIVKPDSKQRPLSDIDHIVVLPQSNKNNYVDNKVGLPECSDLDSNLQPLQSDLEVLLSDNDILTDG